MKWKALIGLGLACLATHAPAHQMWIEQDAAKATIFFGEYGDNLKETVPGLLNKFPVPKVKVKTASEEKDVKVTKTKNSFDLDVKLGAKDALIAQVNDYPVWEDKEDGKPVRMKWIPAARLVKTFQAADAVNTLDVVPGGQPNVFKLVFKGQPLPSAKVALVSPNGWLKEFWTDDKGTFTAAPLWKGLYVIHAEHKDKTAGELNGEKFDATTYTTSVSFVQATGPETKRPEPAKPNPET